MDKSLANLAVGLCFGRGKAKSAKLLTLSLHKLTCFCFGMEVSDHFGILERM